MTMFCLSNCYRFLWHPPSINVIVMSFYFKDLCTIKIWYQETLRHGPVLDHWPTLKKWYNLDWFNLKFVSFASGLWQYWPFSFKSDYTSIHCFHATQMNKSSELIFTYLTVCRISDTLYAVYCIKTPNN